MLSDDHGTDFLPLRLIVVLLATALLLELASVAVADQSKRHSAALAKAGMSRLIETARAEYVEGGPGPGAAISLAVPSGIKCIIVGGRPSAGVMVPDEHFCCLEQADGSTDMVYTDFPVAGETEKGIGEGPLVLYPGRYLLTVRTADSGSLPVAAISAREA